MENGGEGPTRTERVMFETDRHMVVGDMTLPPEGYQARLSDAMNRSDVSFVRIVDVEITPIGGGPAVKHDFVVLSKAHIRMAQPLNGSA
jgi:uncharacterized protein DUF6812